MRVISWNIWGSPFRQLGRVKGVLNLFDRKIDIIALQEVTEKTCGLIMEKALKTGYFFCSSFPTDTSTMIFSRFKIIDFRFHKFSNTNTGKGLLRARVKYRNTVITVCTTQFDSDLAESQLKCCNSVLSKTENCVFTGDTTMSKTTPPPNYKNAVPELSSTILDSHADPDKMYYSGFELMSCRLGENEESPKDRYSSHRAIESIFKM